MLTTPRRGLTTANLALFGKLKRRTAMASDNPSTPQLKPHELPALAARLRARADSVLLRDQPEQQSDLRTAAREFERLITGIRKAAAETTDAATQRALAGLIGEPGEPA
jgi:hypothetical protein